MDLADRQSKIDAFVTEARSFVGCKWGHRGRSRYRVDCIGLVVLSLQAAGLQMRDRLDYGRYPWQDGLDREMREHFGDAVDYYDLEPGDIVTMRGIGQPEPGHVGVIARAATGYLTLIHSYNADANTRVVEHRIDDAWSRRIAAVYRPFP